MKYIFLITIIIFSNISHSQQWNYNSIKDEFGDDTNQKQYQIKLIGTFNNSAQTGAKAILILSYVDDYYEFDNSYGKLRFDMYEYSNNPADFNRQFHEIELALKNSDGDVHRSLTLTNEFSSDNSFTMTQYFNPTAKISERTIEIDKGDYIELIKPTYDIDFNIIEDVIYKKGRVKLNIYSSDSEYFFEFNSLGLTHSKKFNQLKSIEQKKIEERELKITKENEQRELKIKEENDRALIKQKNITSIVKNIQPKLDEMSLDGIKRFLNKIEETELNSIKDAELFLYKAPNNFDIRLNKLMFKSNGYVSVDFIKNNGTSLDLKKYSEFDSSVFNEYIALTHLTLNVDSDFKTSYLKEANETINSLNNNIENLFSDKFGGYYFKSRIKNQFEFSVFYYNVKKIENLILYLKENGVDFIICYANGHKSNVKIEKYDFYGNQINLKKFAKANNFKFNEEQRLIN